jgi:hypothetical protein
MSEGAAVVSKKSYAGDDWGIPPFKKEGLSTQHPLVTVALLRSVTVWRQ